MASHLRQSQTLDMVATLDDELKKHSTILAAFHASAIAVVERALILWYAPGYEQTAYSGILDLINDLLGERFAGVSPRTHGFEATILQAVLTVRTWVRLGSLDCCLSVSTEVELLEDKWEKSETLVEDLFGLSGV